MSKTAHFLILITYTFFSVILIGESILLSWEVWVLPLIGAGVIVAWGLHILQSISEKARVIIYTVMMLLTAFFYGIHETSAYDLCAVMCSVLILYAMTGEKVTIVLAMFTYYLAFGYDLVMMAVNGVVFDSLVITRSLLHVSLIAVVGWICFVLINKWNEALQNTAEEIEDLKVASRRMDDFLANLSHEIRTPINAVIGLATVMLKKEKDEDIRRDLHSVSDAGHRVAEQIGDILDYTELDIGKLAINNETYMISSLINDLITEMQTVKETDLEIVIDVDATIPSAMVGDAGKIRKIMWHLINNGIKFTKEGGVYVRIFTLKRPYGVNLCIEVRDTGIGMTGEEIDKIYEKFYQSDSGRTRAAGGLGLGMPIVHGFVNSMDGFLTIDSSYGEGTKIMISIPQKVADETPCMSLVSREELCLAGYLHFDKYDVPEVREYYTSMIQNMVRGLNIPFYRVDSAEELKKLQAVYKITHLFVGAEEYDSDREFIESLTKEMTVAVVCHGDFEPLAGSKVKILRKPFYCFPVATILNASIDGVSAIENDKFKCPNLKVLVVDDEPMNLIVANGIFKGYGMKVETATSGPESIEKCKNQMYDVVFMDHMMPGMDGIEAMKKIRANAGKIGQEILIVALTANAVSSAKDMFLSEGFDGFVPKPIEITDLERVLKHILPKSAIVYENDITEPSEAATSNEGGAVSSGGIEETKEPDEAPGMLAILQRGDIDTKTGMGYCQNDEEFYGQLLEEYVSSSTSKKNDIKKYYETKDWANYAILVHALKSTSKMIGATALFELARSMETAAKENKEDEIEQGHNIMLTMYSETVNTIRTALKSSKPEGGDDSGADADVMEFAPEADEEVMEFAPEGDDEVLEFSPEGDQ